MTSPNFDSNAIVKRIDDHFREIWRCADSGYWNEFKKADLFSFEYLRADINYKLLKRNQILRGHKSIFPWVNELSVGDLVFVMAKNEFNAIGVVRKSYEFNSAQISLGGEKRPAIELHYIYKADHPLKAAFSTSPQPATFSKINQYRFGLQRTIDILIEKLPEAVTNLITFMDLEEKTNEQFNNIKQLDINTIFYGPPGTGKTYELSLLKNLFTDEFTAPSSQDSLRQKLSDYKYWEVIAAILYASEEALTVKQICQHDLYKARFNPTNKVKPQNMAWVDLQAYATDESTNSSAKYRRGLKLFQKDENSKWSITEESQIQIEDIIDEELLNLAKNPEIKNPNQPVIHERFQFVTFHQKYTYEDFIEGIKPVLIETDSEIEGSDLQFQLQKGIFYKACLSALQLVGFSSFKEAKQCSFEERKAKFSFIKNDPQKLYAIFIDEINRANISAVFGELITLVEDDKRMGQESELWLRLPVSGDDFCIPSNLYIFGTMNTADKSISLIDIALRRRFEFKAMYPKYILPSDPDPWWSAQLEKLNLAIYEYKNKNADFFVGHAFFMNKKQEDAKKIYNTRIIPLLLEYFQNNTDKVEKLLNSAGITVRRGTIRENFQLIAE